MCKCIIYIKALLGIHMHCLGMCKCITYIKSYIYTRKDCL